MKKEIKRKWKKVKHDRMAGEWVQEKILSEIRNEIKNEMNMMKEVALLASPPPSIATRNQSHFGPCRMVFKGWIEDHKQCRLYGRDTEVHRGLAEEDPRRITQAHRLCSHQS